MFYPDSELHGFSSQILEIEDWALESLQTFPPYRMEKQSLWSEYVSGAPALLFLSFASGEPLECQVFQKHQADNGTQDSRDGFTRVGKKGPLLPVIWSPQVSWHSPGVLNFLSQQLTSQGWLLLHL